MRTTVLAAWLAAAGLALGCGGKQAAPEAHYDVHAGSGSAADHDGAEPDHDMDHGVGIAEVDGFHAQLEPIMHATGDAQKTDACAKTAALKDAAFQVVGRAKGDHAAWEDQATALAAAVDGLGKACTGGGDVAAALGAVHDAFHAVLAAASAKTEPEPAAGGD
jgi:hypothetical protein